MQPTDPNYRKVFESIWKIEKAVLETVDFEKAAAQVVNIILTELGYINSGYKAIVLTLLDEDKKTLRRIAISNTEDAARFLRETPIPFNDIVIPMWATENLLVKAVTEKKRFVTDNVSDVFVPALDREWIHTFAESLGLKTTIVYPIVAKDKTLGAIIFTLSKAEMNIKEEEWAILESFVGAVGIALDNALLFRSLNITAEKLKEANEKLKEEDKLKDEFLSIASHELRTPMTTVKDYISTMLDDNTISAENKEKLERIYASSKRLIALVNDNLDISKIESGAMEFILSSFDISKLAFEVKDELTDKYTRKNLKVEVLVGNYNVKADRDKIHQVLLNLMDNAVKFTPNNGTIEVLFNQKEDVIETTVSDSGIGIAPEDMNKLFFKFQKITNPKYPYPSVGTGLGLYLSKMIIEKSGGTIRAESELGKGTKFIFTLPSS